MSIFEFLLITMFPDQFAEKKKKKEAKNKRSKLDGRMSMHLWCNKRSPETRANVDKLWLQDTIYSTNVYDQNRTGRSSQKKDMKNSVFYIRKKICPWEPRYSTVEWLPGTKAVLQRFQVCACCSERPASSGLLKHTERHRYTQSKVPLGFTVLRWKKP